MTQQHTPIPWEYDEVTGQVYSGDQFIHESPDCDDGRTDEELAANARFIVQACNAHEDLLAALIAVADGDSTGGEICWCHKSANHEVFCQEARAAIAQATSPQAR